MPLWWSLPILLVLGAALFLLRARNAHLEEQRTEIANLYARRARELEESEELELHQRHGDEICLVLSDVVMPGIGGIEMVRRLEEQGLKAAVLFMTGYAPRDGETGHPTPEGTECLQKPFFLEELAEAISQALRRRRERLDG